MRPPSRARPVPPPSFTVDGVTRPLMIRRVAGARGWRLRVDPRDGSVRLTLPPRGALAPAFAWAEGKRDWIEVRLANAIPPVPLVPGGAFALEGAIVTIAWAADAPRGVTREGLVLTVGGPAESVAPRLPALAQAAGGGAAGGGDHRDRGDRRGHGAPNRCG